MQLVLQNVKVLKIELCKNRLNMEKYNAGIHSVADDIEFILGYGFHLIPVLKNVDAVLI